MINKVSSLPQLINLLNHTSKEAYESLGLFFDIPMDEYLPYLHWSNENYTRNCIVREKNFELILLCWEPGQYTDIHCHGGESCWVHMIEGIIEESIYEFEDNLLILINKTTLNAGDKSFMSDNMGYHSLRNNSSSRAISLHLYMKPIDECTVYDNEAKTFLARSLSYDSILDS